MKNVYLNAQFMKSAKGYKDAPEDQGSEVAFVGRSNAGKSSALNALTNQNKLAKTSKTPGRTRLLNFFSIDDTRRLVDLPGYGYAKVSAGMKNEWQKSIDEYLQIRESLAGLVLLMDIRHPLTPFDEMILDWCEDAQMPIHVLLTKSDKFKYGRGKSILLDISKKLDQRYSVASCQLFSATKKTGLEDLVARLDHLLDMGVE